MSSFSMFSFKANADELTDIQRDSISMLNYITYLTQEINTSKYSRIFLEEAAGIAAALLFGLLNALVFKPRSK